MHTCLHFTAMPAHALASSKTMLQSILEYRLQSRAYCRWHLQQSVQQDDVFLEYRVQQDDTLEMLQSIVLLDAISSMLYSRDDTRVCSCSRDDTLVCSCIYSRASSKTILQKYSSIVSRVEHTRVSSLEQSILEMASTVEHTLDGIYSRASSKTILQSKSILECRLQSRAYSRWHLQQSVLQSILQMQCLHLRAARRFMCMYIQMYDTLYVCVQRGMHMYFGCKCLHLHQSRHFGCTLCVSLYMCLASVKTLLKHLICASLKTLWTHFICACTRINQVLTDASARILA